MKTTIKLFAKARDLAGTSLLEIELSESATAADLRVALGEQVPAMRQILGSLLVAVGNDYATPTTQISGRTDVAVFPPVSGG